MRIESKRVEWADLWPGLYWGCGALALAAVGERTAGLSVWVRRFAYLFSVYLVSTAYVCIAQRRRDPADRLPIWKLALIMVAVILVLSPLSLLLAKL